MMGKSFCTLKTINHIVAKAKKILFALLKRALKVHTNVMATFISQVIRKTNNQNPGSQCVIFLSPHINSYDTRPVHFMEMMLPLAYGLAIRKYNIKFFIANSIAGLKNLNSDALIEFSGRFGDARLTSNLVQEGLDKTIPEWGASDYFVYDGVDYYQVCLAQVQHYTKKYTVSLENKNDKELFKKFYRNCVAIHQALKELERLYSDKALYIVGNESNHLPNAAVWWYTVNTRASGIQYIDYNRGYQHYWGAHYRHLGMSLRNVTKYKENRMYVTKSELEEQVRALSRSDLQSHIPLRDCTSNVIDHCADIDEWNEVFCLYSHVMYDLQLPDDSGEFSGITDWINTICDYFSKNQDKLLLIKPHPSENPKQKSKEPNERTRDVIKDQYHSCRNIRLLPAENISGLEARVSCALVWRSSVGLELAIRGIPVVLFGAPDYRELPFVKCHSKENVASILNDRKYRVQDDSLPLKCAAYLEKRKDRIINLELARYSEKLDCIHFFTFASFLALVTRVTNMERKIVESFVRELSIY